MAETTVEIILEKLKQLLLQHAHRMPNSRDLVESLNKSLYQFKSLRAEAETDDLRDLIRRIRHAVYDAEDAIDDYIFQDAILGLPSIADVLEEVRVVVKEFQSIYSRKSTREIISARTRVKKRRQDQSEESQVKGTNVLGLEDEINKLKAYIFEESTELDAISIVGISGLGKTTLAHQIFHDREIGQEFVTRIWVYVSKEFRKKDIFLAILEEFTILTDDIMSRRDEDLANLVVSYLENERFLLVIDDSSGREIRTLGAIAPESCTKDFFERVPNLKRLGVRGKLALLLDEKNDSFDGLSKLSNLEKLKLLNDIHLASPTEFQLVGLPPASKFPPNLKILTLSRTALDWIHMSVLGSLESLVVLKVKDKAFLGDKWEVADGGFCHLEVLHIERTNLKIWLASDHHFPRLRHLQLKHCDNLEQVPIELADVDSFLKLDLFHCRRAAACALKIEEKKKQQVQFEISIIPWRDTHASV